MGSSALGSYSHFFVPTHEPLREKPAAFLCLVRRFKQASVDTQFSVAEVAEKGELLQQ